MATVDLQVANPTDTTVTVNSQDAIARSVTVLTINTASTDAYGFLAAGCALTSTTGSTFQEREQQGFMLEYLGDDTIDSTTP